MTSRYQPTSLPVRLDLSRMDTASQLHEVVSRKGAYSSPRPAREEIYRDEMTRMCNELIEKEIQAYIICHMNCAINEEDSFYSWLRHFHSEYDDSWFDMNRERLIRSFRPLWSLNYNKSPSAVPIEFKEQFEQTECDLLGGPMYCNNISVKTEETANVPPDLLG